MRQRCVVFALVLTLCSVGCSSVAVSPSREPREWFISVADGTKIHVLEWGTTGEPVILLAGLTNTGYIYSDFVQLLNRRFHVIAITRRGHGLSGQVTAYDPDSLAGDIRDVLDAFHIVRANLVGHSIAGVELTAFATRYPERTRSLVYLDAAYDRQLQAVWDDRGDDPVPEVAPSQNDLRSIESYLAYRRRQNALPGAYYGKIWSRVVEQDSLAAVEIQSDGSVRERHSGAEFGAMWQVAVKQPVSYSKTRAPILAIYAEPPGYPFLPEDASRELIAKAQAFYQNTIIPWTKESIRELRSDRPDATVVEMSDALHHVFITSSKRTATLVNDFVLAQRP